MTYREAVLTISDKARQALPLHASRIEKAVTLCLNGHVEVVEGKYRIASQQDGKSVYHLANGSCTCQDFTSGKAQGWCKHRLAGNIYRKAMDMIKAQEPVATHYEAPSSANVRVSFQGHDVQITLRDTHESTLLTRLQAVLAQFPLEAPATTPRDDFCAIHHITMTRRNGKYGA